MNIKETIASLTKALLDKCLKEMHSRYQDEEITDFYIHIDLPSHEIRIVDDNDTLLSRVSIPDEILSSDMPDDNDDPDSPHMLIRSSLQEGLAKLQAANAFDKVNVFHPFSFVLEDDELLEDLLIVDDSNVIIGDELLKGLDDDLDSFIEQLMKE